jgi:hypothetical protein
MLPYGNIGVSFDGYSSQPAACERTSRDAVDHTGRLAPDVARRRYRSHGSDGPP